MTKTEYIARVISYYRKNKIKYGYLTFDKNEKRFVIKGACEKASKAYPYDGLHCGDVYIVRDKDEKWRIAQCELATDGIWKMLGTEITERDCFDENGENVLFHVLYVDNKRLMRFDDEFINESFQLGELSSAFIISLMGVINE